MATKLMIVDDEMIIRQGLRHAVDWQSIDVEICGESSNGRDAMSKMALLQPDIVISDIKMPFVNGIELARFVHDVFPATRVIILTGYGDHEYLLEAIKAGVYDFIMKPANPSDVLRSVAGICAAMHEQREQTAKNNLNERLVNEHWSLLRQDFLHAFLHNSELSPATLEKAAMFEIDLLQNNYLLFIVKAGARSAWHLINTLNQVLGRFHPFCCTAPVPEYVMGVLPNMTPASFAEIVNASLAALRPHFCGSFLCSPGLSSARQFTAAYDRIIAGSRRCYLQEQVMVCCADTADHIMPIPSAKSKRIQLQMDASLQARDAYQFTLALSELFAAVDEYQPEFELFCGLILNVADALAYFSNNDSLKANFVKYLDSMPSKSDIFAELSRLGNEFFASDPAARKVTGAILGYVDNNYQRNLTTAEMANLIHVSKSYFCRCFHSETGKSFNEWLNEFRIGKAKLLLTNPEYRTSQIAEMIGYGSYKLFAKNFYKYVGCSARDYRSHAAANGNPLLPGI